MIKSAKNILVEPVIENYFSGRQNFVDNNAQGEFLCAAIGGATDDARALSVRDILTGIPVVSVQDIFDRFDLSRINILHSDIQGGELEMLSGCRILLEKKLIDYLFISTHSNELHYSCVRVLQGVGYAVIASIDMRESCSDDGLIVAVRPMLTPQIISFSRRIN